eukprot:3482391-Rhodomonas_salina.4
MAPWQQLIRHPFPEIPPNQHRPVGKGLTQAFWGAAFLWSPQSIVVFCINVLLNMALLFRVGAQWVRKAKEIPKKKSEELPLCRGTTILYQYTFPY